MPIERFRRVADVPAPAQGDPSDPALLERVFALWAFATGSAGPLYAPGVHRFGSIEAADAAREAALVTRMRRLARVGAAAGER